SRENEHIVTIDGADHELSPEMLVIADADRPIALAGIMGGNNSEITESTTRIVLESATFDGRSVRRTSRALHLGTEASKRFDKGLDIELPAFAARRALALMQQMARGTLGGGLIDVR